VTGNRYSGLGYSSSLTPKPQFQKGKEKEMPTVQISLLPGRTPEKKEELIKNVTHAIADTLQIPKDRVHILLYEIPKENIAHGGIPLSKVDSR
jgi:4-oxalocrotonate tautomerase